MKKIIFSALFAILVVATVALSNYFPDIIVTSPNGIWTDTRAYSNLNAAISAVGANVRDIYIVRQEVTAASTINANTHLRFFGSGSIANSAQLTINSTNISAGNRQIFTGAGDIDFAEGTVVRSSWFSNIERAFTLTVDDTVSLIVSEPQTITANSIVGDDVILKWESPGNILSPSIGITITIGKSANISAQPAQQIFAGNGSIEFTNIDDAVWCNWWGTDNVALQAAIDSSGSAIWGTSVKVAGTIDIGVNTVTLKQGMVLSGNGIRSSTITMNGGSLSFGTYSNNINRLKVIRDLNIVNIALTGNTVDLGVIDGANNGPYANLIKDCKISGGLNSINLDGAVWTTIENTKVRNDGVGVYTIYADATAYVHQTNIVDSRILGNVYLDLSGTTQGRVLNIDGSIFEATNDPVFDLVAVAAGSLHGSYFESYADGANLLELGQEVNGFDIKGNSFSVHSVLDVHVLCDGTSVIFGSNYFVSIGVQDAITLQANSKYCVIQAQMDGGGGDEIPIITDNGTLNEVFAYSHIGQALRVSDTWDPGNILDGEEEAKDVTVTDAVLGDFALCSLGTDVLDLVLNAQVTVADTVTCVLANSTGGAINLASSIVRVIVIRRYR